MKFTLAPLMPATSPSLMSTTSVLKPCCSPQRRYMRSSICAQSWASVPPAPAWMSRNALCESIWPGNMRLNSSCLTSRSSTATSRSTACAVDSSFSSTARFSNSPASFRPLVTRSSVFTTCSRRARSRPSSCALSGVFQILGSSSSRVTSVSRSLLLSYSKKPPQRRVALGQVFEGTAELVGFHGGGGGSWGAADGSRKEASRALKGPANTPQPTALSQCRYTDSRRADRPARRGCPAALAARPHRRNAGRRSLRTGRPRRPADPA